MPKQWPPKQFDALPIREAIDDHTESDKMNAAMNGALEALTWVKDERLRLDAELRDIELYAAQTAFRHGATWGRIADAAGVRRQTAQETYRDRENRPPRRQHSARDTNSWPAALDD